MENQSRRRFFGQALTVAGAVAIGKVAEAAIPPTPRQTSGPFIPDDFPFREPNEGAPYISIAESDVDLTRVAGGRQTAKGQVIYVRGTVVDQNGAPVSNAMVYLWQADDHGHYNHQEDPNVHSAHDLDANFQYRAAVATDATGRFMFKTIKPKYYPLEPGGTQMRTAHLHVAVLHPNCQNLVTQTYFEGDVLEDIQTIRALNSRDIILAPRGTILPELRPLIINFRRDARYVDGVVGDVTLAVIRRR